ncbi:hypothetical protein D3C77_670520 [compost metagenome]
MFINNAPFLDHQQGIGPYAFTGALIAIGKGIGLDVLPGSAVGINGHAPVRDRPGLLANSKGRREKQAEQHR